MIRHRSDIGCRATRSRLLDGLEGRLAVAARLDVEAHLARCAGCADELADLAAARYQVGRALAPYRSARARVSPIRARLAAARPSGARRFLDAFARVGRPAEAVLALAVLAFAFVGSLALVEQEPLGIESERALASRYALDRDDPAWAVRFRYRPSPMVHRSDSLSADAIPASPEAAPGGGGANPSAASPLSKLP